MVAKLNIFWFKRIVDLLSNLTLNIILDIDNLNWFCGFISFSGGQHSLWWCRITQAMIRIIVQFVILLPISTNQRPVSRSRLLFSSGSVRSNWHGNWSGRKREWLHYTWSRENDTDTLYLVTSSLSQHSNILDGFEAASYEAISDCYAAYITDKKWPLMSLV